MPNVIENVIKGVAVLGIREPNDALAEWSTVQKYAGDRSAKLYKGGSGNAGSTHFQVTPPTAQTLTDFQTDPTDYSFWYWYSVVTGNFIQFELRFEDPDSDAWVEVTVVPHQNVLGTGAWLQKSLDGADSCGIGGVSELGVSFFDWDLSTTISSLVTDVNAAAASIDSGPWTLRRVRLEIWEPEPARTAYVDSIELDGVVYTIEPGGTAPAMSLSSPFIDIGYTEDGVTVEYTSDTTDIEVEEETFAIDRALIKEACIVSCTMAEATLVNLKNAMAGAVLSGNILTLGGGVMKTLNLRIASTNPSGYRTEIFIPKATAIGAVGFSFKKGEKTMVPVQFSALKATNSEAVTIVYNTI